MKWVSELLFTPLGFFVTIVTTIVVERILKFMGLEDWVDRAMGHISARWAARSKERARRRETTIRRLAEHESLRRHMAHSETSLHLRALITLVVSMASMQFAYNPTVLAGSTSPAFIHAMLVSASFLTMTIAGWIILQAGGRHGLLDEAESRHLERLRRSPRPPTDRPPPGDA